MIKSIFVLVFFIFFVCGCTSMGRLSKETAIDIDKESIFVIGLASENFRISVFPGSLEDGRFHQSLLRPAAVFASSENGFVIGKASAGDTLAITNIRVVNGKDSLFGLDYAPCNGNLMTFNVPRGKVVYVSNVDYKFIGNELIANYSQDLESARKFIDENYPKLRGQLELWKYELPPTLATYTHFCQPKN